MLCLPLCPLFARQQSDSKPTTEGKIHIELKNDENGKTKSFSKDYSTKEEMLADEELKEFLNEKDLQVYFYGGKKDASGQAFSFAFPDGGDHDIMIFKDLDSLKVFEFNGHGPGAGSYFFQDGEGADSFTFTHPGDPGIHFWVPNHPDSMFAKKLMPLELDSIRAFWQNEFKTADGESFFFEWDDENDGKERVIKIMAKKVTISELSESESVLDKAAPKNMKELEPVELSYFPNPNNGRFTLKLKLESAAPLQLSIVDISGRVIHEEEVKTFDGNYTREFDLSDKGEGIYLLQVRQGESRLVRKIMIN